MKYKGKALQGLAAALLLVGMVPSVLADIRVDDPSSSSSIAFDWDPVEGADRYVVWVGSSTEARDLAAKSASGLSRVVDALPTDGRTLHATLKARVAGRWQTAASTSFAAASEPLIHQRNELTGEIAVFFLREVPAGSTRMLMMAGTATDPDAYDRRGLATDASRVALNELPVDGSQMLVSLWWMDANNRWRKEQPVTFTAASGSAIISPEAGTVLSGSAELFNFSFIAGADKNRIRIGTITSPNAYGVWNKGGSSTPVVGLPLDGSEVVVRYEIHDEQRWVLVSSVTYQAALPGDNLWGDCTAIDGPGQRVRVKMNDGDNSTEWGQTPYSVVTTQSWAVDRILRNNCASDSEYVTIDTMLGVPLRQAAGGLYVWLAPGSGAATLSWEPWTFTGSYPPVLRGLPVAGNVLAPIHVPIPSSAGKLRVKPLDANKPVKITEIRVSALSDDITALRKGRWSGSVNADFTALNGDPRARVTAEIAREFAPDRANDFQFFTAGLDTCGFYNWVDATWEIDQPVIISDEPFNLPSTVWVNWNLASNEDIWEAINASIDYGETNFPRFPYSDVDCTRADGSLIYQDWLSKTRAAVAGTYDGPELRYE